VIESQQKVVAITGATGLLGNELARHFLHRGWRVRALVRDVAKQRTPPGVDVFRANLPDVLDESAFTGANAVIHAAYATTDMREDAAKRVNEEGTMRVLAAARDGSAKFIFVSTFSSRPNAISYYGRSKYALEQILDRTRDLVIRPGLILARTGGLFERMRRSVEQSPVIPVFGGGQQILQTVHVDDICVAFERAIDLDLSGELNVAEPEGVSMKDFIRMLIDRLGLRRIVVPFPARPTVAVLKMLEKIRVPTPIDSERLLGALALRHVSTAGDLARLGIHARTAAESLESLI